MSIKKDVERKIKLNDKLLSYENTSERRIFLEGKDQAYKTVLELIENNKPKEHLNLVHYSSD